MCKLSHRIKLPSWLVLPGLPVCNPMPMCVLSDKQMSLFLVSLNCLLHLLLLGAQVLTSFRLIVAGGRILRVARAIRECVYVQRLLEHVTSNSNSPPLSIGFAIDDCAALCSELFSVLSSCLDGHHWLLTRCFYACIYHFFCRCHFLQCFHWN